MVSRSPSGWVWLLSRPLAADEHRARFWVRHVQVGVVLSELTAGIVVLYALLGHRPAALPIAGLAGLVMVAAPVLLLALPMLRWSRDHRGALLFYAWSTATTAVVAGITLLDGGAGSPLVWLLVLTLAYAGLAYPPLGTALMGALMVGTYTGIALLAPQPGGRHAVPAAALTVFTIMTGWASRNQWDMTDQQHLMAQRLSTLADTDELTGCLNRRALHARLTAALDRAGVDEPLSLCVLDLDGFKQVNDTRGHAAGDQVLVAVARALLGAARETDSVSRLGGDEFAVLLPATGAAAAADAGQRLLDRINATVGAAGVTASLGVVTTTLGTASGGPAAADSLLASADRLMYHAKTSGGCDVRCASA